ncbi:uncharacterized protein LOC141641373 [Silene latifolia]|uniref:uncharacterized protein LOC141641373 n=1 Tax=Silene latifolia TaxID=37657 RepID=UPI003D77E071
MGKLVGDFQNAFVPGRNIGDNILITNKILQKISSSRNGRMAFKADMSKAYDQLNENFIRGNSKSCESLDKVIKDYCHASGQVINDNKSSMMLSSCYSLSFARKCLKTFNIPCDTNLGSYLGIPTDVGLSGGNKSKREIFEFFIDKVRKRLFSWNCILLSPTGRLALISSVLSSLSVYFLSVFKIPVSVTKILDAILSHFWWAGHKKSPSISWCCRLFLSQPKGNGDLGIRRMKEFNQALLANIGWRMITHPDSILSKSIGAKYGLKWRDVDLLFNDGKSNSSWGWKGIVWGLQLIKPLLAWNISPFSDLGVWNTKWVHGTVPKPRCVELLIDSPNLCNLRIKDLICNSNSWDHRLVSMSFDETSVNDILAIPIRCSKGNDNFYWSASSSGNYSVKIGYHIALQNSWNTSASPKDRSRVPAASLSVEYGKPGSIAFQTPMEEDLTKLRNGVPFPLIQSSVSCSRSYIYVDEAWSKEFAAGFGGCIIFDNDIVSEFCIKGRAENAEQAEALAIREALKFLPKSYGFLNSNIGLGILLTI